MRPIALVTALLLLGAPATLYFLSSPTQIQIDPNVKAIGEATPLHVKLTNPHGIRAISAVIEQEGKQYTVPGRENPPHRLSFFRNEKAEETTLIVGRKSAPALHDGKARLTIEARANDFRAETTRISEDIEIATKPPRINADSAQHYIHVGGSELVVFSEQGAVVDSGVKVDKYKFRSFPLPNHPNQRFSLFAYPWDLEAGIEPVVYATGLNGATVTAPFSFKVFPKKFKESRIELTEKFMKKVLADIDPDNKIPGDLVTRYVYCNREMRKQNSQTLYDLRLKTEEVMLWKGPFVRPKTKNEAFFADHRSYVYNGEVVDVQTHLGFDLADKKHMPVRAPNGGKVIYAERLGIYGNCIVLDHGYGLQTIYGHLSQIDVKPGDRVERGQEMGLSGETGLAGGDHLHFSMQVDGVQVNPLEWWDAHWIKDRIVSKM